LAIGDWRLAQKSDSKLPNKLLNLSTPRLLSNLSLAVVFVFDFINFDF